MKIRDPKQEMNVEVWYADEDPACGAAVFLRMA